jgi:hypothetical protein
MSARTTSVPDLSTTLTGTTGSTPSVIESKSGQRWLVGTVASIDMPIAISAALHDAITRTVCRWL